MNRKMYPIRILILPIILGVFVSAQPPAKSALGLKTAKASFANENEIAAKFNN
jgi:hypothetical protein